MPIEDLGLYFEAGKHRLRLERLLDGWAVTVDGLSAGARFPSQAEAWRQGVRAAEALERPASRPVERKGQPRGGPPAQLGGPGPADPLDG